MEKVLNVVYYHLLQNAPKLFFSDPVSSVSARQIGNRCEFSIGLENVSIPGIPQHTSLLVKGRVFITETVLGYTIDNIKDPRVKQALLEQIETNRQRIFNALD